LKKAAVAFQEVMDLADASHCQVAFNKGNYWGTCIRTWSKVKMFSTVSSCDKQLKFDEYRNTLVNLFEYKNTLVNV